MDTRNFLGGDTTSDAQRERMLSYAGGVLGVLMVVWGFLDWFEIGTDPDELKYTAYAFQMPTTAIIGFAFAAGMMAILGASDQRRGRGVPSAVPASLAATSFVLAICVYAGRDEVSPDLGVEVGAEIGLILAVITALLQTLVLGVGLASRFSRDD